MPQTILEMAKGLVTEQILVNHISPADVNILLVDTYTTLQNLSQREMDASEPVEEDAPADWKSSITQHAVICLECGASFRQLSTRHLRKHDLTSRAYRVKYGIPSTQPLSSRRATARRRAVAREVRPWEGVARKRGTTPSRRNENEAKT